MKLFSVYDHAAQTYNQPFNSPSLGTAIRSTLDALGDADQEVSKHPDDYDLYYVGHFDEKTGIIWIMEQPHQLTAGTNPLEVDPDILAKIDGLNYALTQEDYDALADAAVQLPRLQGNA